jgi:hypothetical protein
MDPGMGNCFAYFFPKNTRMFKYVFFPNNNKQYSKIMGVGFDYNTLIMFTIRLLV